jgi:hypothetical protein
MLLPVFFPNVRPSRPRVGYTVETDETRRWTQHRPEVTGCSADGDRPMQYYPALLTREMGKITSSPRPRIPPDFSFQSERTSPSTRTDLHGAGIWSVFECAIGQRTLWYHSFHAGCDRQSILL